MTQDPLTHGRKTILGADFTFGATTATPCGKRRPAGRTSADPARVTCPACRAWAANEERELAQMAVTAAGIMHEHPEAGRAELASYASIDFTAVAIDHDARAERWDEPA